MTSTGAPDPAAATIGAVRLRRLRRLRRLILLLAAVPLAVWIGLDIYLFATPSLDRPQHADAVIVLAGDRKPRLDRGLQLVRSGVSRTLVISDGLDPLWPAANRLCREGGDGFRVVCFVPEPYSTRGESRGFARLARENGWTSVVIATSTFHVTRARLLFRRCFAGKVQGVGAHASFGRAYFNYVSEVAKLRVQVTVARGC